MKKTILGTGILFGLLAVVIGAFGAHGLGKVLTLESLATFETGVKYQIYHAFFLLILGNLDIISNKTSKWVYYPITIGTVLFSFSIYFLATNNLTSFDFKTIGFITPIGGLLLILGWALLGYFVIKTSPKK